MLPTSWLTLSKRLPWMAEPFCPEWSKPGRVHLVGIGGVGMAGLARLLHQSGFQVSGSDHAQNRLTLDLQKLGIPIQQGHDPKLLPADLDWAIRTPAVGEGNPEVDALRNAGVPVRVRGEVLGSYSRRRQTIAVAGAHGKTTTSSMLAHTLRKAGVDAGYAIGGETTLPGRISDLGKQEIFVCEADESDGTLVFYAPDIAVLTHIEWDHVERFRSEASLLNCYRVFAEQTEKLWIREGDLLAEKVCQNLPSVKRVGVSGQAALQILSAESDHSGTKVSFRFHEEEHRFQLPMPGFHNALNATMAIAAASEIGVSVKDACKALELFGGVARRFQKRQKRGVVLIQDYAHHPTEIRAVIASAKALSPQRLWLVFQPHRFSRTRHLLNDFAESFQGVDRLGLLPVYAASELPGQGAGSQLLEKVCKNYPGEVHLFQNHDELINDWVPQFQEGDVVLIVGAGDIEALQGEFLDVL